MLAEYGKLIHEIARLSPLGVILIDLDAHCHYSNKVWEENSGLGGQGVLGSQWLDLLTAESKKELLDCLRACREGSHESARVVVRFRNPVQGLRHCQFTIRYFPREPSNPPLFLCYVQDRTESFQTNEQLSIQNKLLHLLKSIQDEFYLSEEHDPHFRELLNRILGILDTEWGFLAEVLLPEEGASSSPGFNILALSEPGSLESAELLCGEIYGSGKELFQFAGKDRFLEAAAPFLQSFAGFPLHLNNEIVGLVGLGNRRGGFRHLAGLVEALSRTLSSLILFHRMHKQKMAAESHQKELTCRLNTLIASLDDVVMEVDGESMVCLNIWARNEELLFCPKSYFPGKSLLETIGPGIRPLTDAIREVVETGEERSVSYADPCLGLQQRFRSGITPILDDGEKIRRVVVTIRDITQHWKNEQSLSEAREKLERTNELMKFSQEMSQTGGWEFNLETRETFLTDQVFVINDLPKDLDVKHFDFFRLLDGDTRDESGKVIFESICRHTPFEIEYRNQNGKWLSIMGQPVIKSGKPALLRGAIKDISEKKKNEEELIRAKELAEEASRAKTNFLSVMSHEIRTPLNAIIGIANLLRHQKIINLEEYLDHLLFSANHLLELVNEILDFSKIESDKLELMPREVDLMTLVEEIVLQFRLEAQAKGIQLIRQIDPQLPRYIVADKVRLNQILVNLLGNAMKFTEKGSVSLTLKALRVEDAEVSIHFSVRDTGIGIPLELQSFIFESFHQLHQESYRKYTETGLGLAITKKLVELHDSEIHLRSSPDKGAEFYFEICFPRPARNKRNIGRVQRENILEKYHGAFGDIDLLLVEDNKINTLVACKQLEFFGIRPDCAANGREALKMLQQKSFHLALIDLHMPEMDGYEFSAHVKTHHPLVHTVIFTADIMPEVRSKLAAMDIHEIITKPFSPEDILAVLLKAREALNWPSDLN